MKITNRKTIEKDGWVYTTVDVYFKKTGTTETLFYGTQEKYKEYICNDNADNILIGLFPIAKKYDENITFEGMTISKTLVEKIQEHLIPAFIQMGVGSDHSIDITPTANDKVSFGKRKSATGISLGVDSFYSINNIIENNEDFFLLTFFCNQSMDESEAGVNDELYAEKLACAKQYNKELIPVVSNISFFLTKVFAFEQIHTFCNLSYAMFLSEGIDRYYYASGYSKSKLSFAANSYYDFVIVKTIDYPQFSMISSGAGVSRVEKTEHIMDDPIVQKHIHICLRPSHRDVIENCCSCTKCIRTMATLDMYGKLDLFSEKFDVDLYKKKKPFFWGDVLYRKTIMHDIFAKEIIDKAKEKHYKIPISSKFYFIKQGIGNQYRKLKRKSNK